MPRLERCGCLSGCHMKHAGAHQNTPMVTRRRRDRRSLPQKVSSCDTPTWYTGTRSARQPEQHTLSPLLLIKQRAACLFCLAI